MSSSSNHVSGTAPGGLSARDRSRRRKWIYGISMIVLIVVLFTLSYPATLSTKDVKGQPGGILAQYRDQHRLSQTELGQIDPTSETIRLATLGMRGIASTVLGEKAIQYQMKKDWTRLRATLDQSIKLQPHSIQVWRYQAWNLSYNVSVSFDDYHDKFYWVIEGLNYMLDGVRMNDREPRLYWDMAWFLSNKIGRDDAAKYYRSIFRGERGPDGKEPPDYIKDFRERFYPPADLRGAFPAVSRPTPTSATIGRWARAGSWPRRTGSTRPRPALPGPGHGPGDLLFRRPHLPVLLRQRPGERRRLRPGGPAGLARGGKGVARFRRAIHRHGL